MTDLFDPDFEAQFDDELADLQFLHDDPDFALDEIEANPRRVSPLREPRRTGLQSSDPVLSICVHELARALEEFARKQYVVLYAGDAEFETAAIEIAEKLSAYKCQLKGV